jgi:hypothetical protein
MSDPEIWETYKDLQKMRQAKRANNREQSAEMLKRAGFAFERKNDGAHLIVQADGYVVDFWPGTGKWITRGYRFTITNRGIRNLLKHLQEKQP